MQSHRLLVVDSPVGVAEEPYCSASVTFDLAPTAMQAVVAEHETAKSTPDEAVPTVGVAVRMGRFSSKVS